jgi:hypothetical protein
MAEMISQCKRKNAGRRNQQMRPSHKATLSAALPAGTGLDRLDHLKPLELGMPEIQRPVLSGIPMRHSVCEAYST